MRSDRSTRTHTLVAVVVEEEEVNGEGSVGGEIECVLRVAHGLADGNEACVDAAWD